MVIVSEKIFPAPERAIVFVMRLLGVSFRSSLVTRGVSWSPYRSRRSTLLKVPVQDLVPNLNLMVWQNLS